MSKYAYPFEVDGKVNPGLSTHDYIATEILKGLVANPNLVDVTNVIRASGDAATSVQNDEANVDHRLVNFAHVLADRMVAQISVEKATA